MAQKLDSVSLTRARELRDRAREVWIRRVSLAVLAGCSARTCGANG